MRCGCSSPGVIGCTCTLIGQDAVIVSGDGSVANPYSLASVIASDPNQLVVCGASGLRGTVSEVVMARAVIRNTDQSIVSGTATAIIWQESHWATSLPLTWSAGVNPSRLTVPAGGAGKYVFAANVLWQSQGSNAQRRATIRRNGTHLLADNGKATFSGQGGNAIWAIHNVLTIADMAVGDYVEVLAFQNSGSSQNVLGNSVLAGARLTRG